LHNKKEKERKEKYSEMVYLVQTVNGLWKDEERPSTSDF
jgi:hypothetical protein